MGERLPTPMSASSPSLRPNAFRDTWCGQVLGERVDSEARVAGWVHRRRDHGGLIFIDLRDRTGIVQLVFHPDSSGDAFELGHRLRAEDVAERGRHGGTALRGDRQPGAADRRVRARASAPPSLLADAETPPFQIEGFSGEVGEDARLRHRYLDLRREPMREALALRHRVTAAMREFLDGEGFLDVETPVLTRSTPEGARDFLVPSRLQRGCLLRAAAVSAAVQAAADGRRLRALLPDRPLLPRRGPARRPPARLHPARHRDVLRRRRRRDRGRTRGCWPTSSSGSEARRSSCRSSASPTTRRWTASAPTGPTCASGWSSSTSRRRCARPSSRSSRGAIGSGGAVRGLNAGAPRAAALRARRTDLPRPGAGGKGSGLGLPRGRGLALADRQVPLRGGAARAERAARRRGGRPAAAGRRPASRSPTRCSASCGSIWPSASS